MKSRWRASVWLLFLIGISSGTLAQSEEEDVEPPQMELLEFLGSWEEDGEVWLEMLEDLPVLEGEQEERPNE